MITDRRLLLHLVALGRITPAEAERLLIAWNEGCEVIWAITAGLAAVLLTQLHLYELLPGLEHAVHAIPASGPKFSHHALALITHWFGGAL
jgi:hypothetical protein